MLRLSTINWFSGLYLNGRIPWKNTDILDKINLYNKAMKHKAEKDEYLEHQRLVEMTRKINADELERQRKRQDRLRKEKKQRELELTSRSKRFEEEEKKRMTSLGKKKGKRNKNKTIMTETNFSQEYKDVFMEGKDEFDLFDINFSPKFDSVIEINDGKIGTEPIGVPRHSDLIR